MLVFNRKTLEYERQPLSKHQSQSQFSFDAVVPAASDNERNLQAFRDRERAVLVHGNCSAFGRGDCSQNEDNAMRARLITRDLHLESAAHNIAERRGESTRVPQFNAAHLASFREQTQNHIDDASYFTFPHAVDPRVMDKVIPRKTVTHKHAFNYDYVAPR